MKEIKAVIRPAMLEDVLIALRNIEGLPGITTSEVKGFGKTKKTIAEKETPEEVLQHENRIKLEIVVPDELAEKAIKVIAENARTGGRGDGKIFLLEVLDVVKIRTGERGRGAI